MIPDSGCPNVVEFNVRFGDPECQITLPLIESDLFELLNAAATDGLSKLEVKFSALHAATVVLAAEGYPSSPVKGRTVRGAESEPISSPNGMAWVNHAGTARGLNGELISTGGRVLACSATGPTLGVAVEMAYALLDTIELEGSHFRTDIGFRAL
jgi:phosphoribosylamine--glycine ligase